MPQPLEAERLTLGADLKSFSCLACRERKVKCNRLNPCSNCKRALRQCCFVPPVRGKPKRRKAPKEGLHAKMRRYEEILKSYGAEIEPSDSDNINSDVEIVSEPDVEMAEDASYRSKSYGGSFAFDETKPRLIAKNGSSRYFDNGVWSNLENEFHNSEEDTISESVDGSTVQTSGLSVDSPGDGGLVLSALSKIEDLASLHHPIHILQKMVDVYVDRVDPLVKLLHVPTFRSTLISALRNPHDMSKSLEALIFAFYLVTIISLDDNECCRLLGERKPIASARYKTAARQALINAEFLKTSSLMTLQAYVIFLIGMRRDYQSDSLFILSGIAVRLGRRMGLHRDGSLLGLSPFETEMRRRLWWHIVHIDCCTSDLSGTKPSMDLFLSDTKMPLNIADEDLSPAMVNPPPDRTGITTVVICLLRCEITNFLGKLAPQVSYDVRWDSLTSATVTLAEKDNMISRMEDILERKYLRYYDPSNPLHSFSSLFARGSICKMKLLAHNPRQFANCGVKVPQSSRDIIFANGTKVLEYASLMHGDQSLKKFTWQTSTNYMWDPLLYVLIEARHRKIGPEVDRAWQVIGGIFTNYPRIFAEATETLHAALYNWTLQVWDECAAARNSEGLLELPTPGYVSSMRCYRKPSGNATSKSNGFTAPERATENSTSYGKAQSPTQHENPIIHLEPIESYDFSNLLSFDLAPSEWVQWELLLAGQGV